MAGTRRPNFDQTIKIWYIQRMSLIRFETKLYTIGSWTIIRLPKSVSAKLPSRGMVLVKGTINGSLFKAVLEPDGKLAHWFRIDAALSKTIKAKAGDTVTLAIEPDTDWPEPKVPIDIKSGLTTVPEAQALWNKIMPMARWDWIRWIGSTKSSETRKRRIEVAASKLKSGEHRPCCFNRNMCCEPAVSNNGVLIDEPSKLL